MTAALRFAFALATFASTVSAVEVYPHYMNPRLHPDETRRTVKPPDRSQFGNRMQFTSIRHIADNENWRKELDWYVVSNRLGNLVWPNVSFLNNRNYFEVVLELRKRGLWLFDVWGFLPDGCAQGVTGPWTMPEGVGAILERELGPRWLGMDNGEQDGRWCGSFGPARDDRFHRYVDFQRYFERLDLKLGNKLAALVSLNYGHYFLRENCYTMLGAETAQALPNGQVYYAYIRGAGKQYGVPWFGNVSIYNRWGWKNYTDNPRQDYGPTKGTSLALMKKLLYAQLFYNGLACGFEGSFFRGGFSGRGRISPIGEMQREAVEWIDRNGDPGVMHTPVAVMTDFYAGWTFPQNLYGWPYVCWGNIPFEAGDYLTDGVLDMLYPGYQNSGFFHDERGFNSPTPYGDIADCLLNDAPLWVLRQYPLLILAGRMRPDEELRDTLRDYVAQGGHLVLTEGNRKILFAEGLPSTGKGGRVTLIPSEWGVVDTPQCPLPVRKKDDVTFPKPYPLTAETRRILDGVLREQAAFVTDPEFKDDGLSVVTCRRGKGDYTLAVMNNGWTERPLELTSRVGKILSVEELETSGRERLAVGFLPECVTNAVLGRDLERTIAGGSTRLLRVKVEETGVREIAESVPPANPTNRTLYLRSNEEIKVQILRRPTFFRHFDSVMVGWRYVFDRDDEALAADRNWIDLQGLGVLVDFSDALNVFPDFRWTDELETETQRSRAAFSKLIRKCALLGVKTIVIQTHRWPQTCVKTKDKGSPSQIDGIRLFCREAAASGIGVRLRQNVWDPAGMRKSAAKVGLPTCGTAASLAVILYRKGYDPLPEIRAEQSDLWFLGLPKDEKVVCDPYFNFCQPLASSPRKDLDALLKEISRKGARVVFDADYVDTDAEYRDVKRFSGKAADRMPNSAAKMESPYSADRRF